MWGFRIQEPSACAPGLRWSQAPGSRCRGYSRSESRAYGPPGPRCHATMIDSCWIVKLFNLSQFQSWYHLDHTSINQFTINQHEPSDLSLHPPPGLRLPHLCWGRLHGLSIRPKIVLWKCDCKWEWVTQKSWEISNLPCYRSAACEYHPGCLWGRHHCWRIHPWSGHLLPCHSGIT